MIYASVCSGIEAASVAWEPLGWQAAWFSEIEPFPSAVLAHHYPTVPNLGDMTKIKGDEHGAIDLLVGGTPCQDLSVAGKRMGFGGKRSVLALDFVRLAYESGAKWFVWENVPGVFSSNGGEDFAQLLSLFAGWQVDTPADGWGSFGIIEQSPGCIGVAWRVLDVQYCRVDGFPRAIPQRRNRVFLVGYLGDWRRAAQVLFEPEGLLGNSPPRREAREGTAEGAGERAANTGRPWDESGVNPSLCRGGLGGIAASNQELFAQNANGLVFDARGNGDGVTCPTVTGDHAGRPTDYTPVVCSAVAPTLDASFARLQGIDNQHIDGGAGLFVAFPIDTQSMTENHASGGKGFGDNGDPSFTITKGHSPAIAIAIADVIHSDTSCNGKGWNDDGSAYTLDTMATQGLMQASCVRRLTPRECERLMGFPDDWTRIPWRGKPAEDCPDGPRYKACGNSMGVNVMRWIGTRIQEVEEQK